MLELCSFISDLYFVYWVDSLWINVTAAFHLKKKQYLYCRYFTRRWFLCFRLLLVATATNNYCIFIIQLISLLLFTSFKTLFWFNMIQFNWFIDLIKMSDKTTSKSKAKSKRTAKKKVNWFCEFCLINIFSLCCFDWYRIVVYILSKFAVHSSAFQTIDRNIVFCLHWFDLFLNTITNFQYNCWLGIDSRFFCKKREGNRCNRTKHIS